MVKLKYPAWAIFVGVSMTIASIGLIPAIAVLRYFGIPRYTKEYPPTIEDPPDHAEQTFIVNNDNQGDVNQNKQWPGKSSKKFDRESFV